MPIDIANMVVNIGTTHSKDLVNIFSALLTPTIAIFMAIIALQQWQTAEKKRKQDLFELRYDNLFLPILNNSDRYNMYEKEKFENLDWDKKSELDKQFSKQLHKYKFLIKKSDFDSLMTLHNNLCSVLIRENLTYNDENDSKRNDKLTAIFQELEKILEEMDEIIGKYLRVETESQSFKQVLIKLFNKNKLTGGE